MAYTANKNEGIYGPGTYTDTGFSPVPQECERLLEYFIRSTPGFKNDPAVLKKVNFHGGDLPILPGPLKAQALSAVCHAMIGIASSEVCALKGIETGGIDIDTDHAGMYPATPALVFIDGKGFLEIFQAGTASSVGADLDQGVLTKTPMRYRSWAIYPTSDQRTHFQIMGNLDPVGLLQAFGLNPDAASSNDEAYEIIRDKLIQFSARELEEKCIENGFCGSTCFTPDGWRQTMMGKQLARHPMINYRQVPCLPSSPPVPFPSSSDKRPLAGIKVLELSRIIAAPAMGMILTSLGAEVIRVQPPHLHDLQGLNLTLTVGKHTCGLNLNNRDDYQRLTSLMQEADVVIQAFRLRSLERRGFGLEHALEMANNRGKGIVYVDLDCYGPDGYYAERPGYQQIADAASGCCYICGKAYGFAEGVGVLPSLPIADMVSGAVGAIDCLLALRDRATKGGSYHACVALTAIDTAQLEREVGLYQPEIVKKIQEKHRFDKMTPDLMVEDLLKIVIEAWTQTTDLLKRNDFFSTFEKTPFGSNHQILSPVVRFENVETSPRWGHGPMPFCWEIDPHFK